MQTHHMVGEKARVPGCWAKGPHELLRHPHTGDGELKVHMSNDFQTLRGPERADPVGPQTSTI